MEIPVEPGSGRAFSLGALPFASRTVRKTFSLSISCLVRGYSAN